MKILQKLGPPGAITLLVVSLAVSVTVVVYCVERDEDETFTNDKKEEPEHPPHVELSEKKSWRFIVSGDSRNCGDVVVPAIAAHSAKNYQPEFYWHLGDLRAIYKVDEDMAFAGAETDGNKLACKDYLKEAWPDFVKHQIYPFSKTQVYLGVGNHEVIPPKGRARGDPETLKPELNSAQYTSYFADWLLSPTIKAQRVKDRDCDKPSSSPCVISARNYYHWVQGGVDFLYLDNASNVFGRTQLDWFKDRIRKAQKDPHVRTVVVGMHEALPDSISTDHAMCDPDMEKRYGEKYPYKQSCDEGREAYNALLNLQNEAPERHVYVLASHSHYFMDGIFKANAKPPADRLRGWIVGTAGAVRYKLPPDSDLNNYAETDVYGYLVGTVDRDGNVQFEFQHLTEADVPAEVRQRYQAVFVTWCFERNSENREPGVKSRTHDDCASTATTDTAHAEAADAERH